MQPIHWTLLLIVLLVFLYIYRRIYRIRNRWTTKKNPLTSDGILNSQHHWNEKISDFRYRCSVCRKNGGGFCGSMIMQCTICGIVKHQHCHSERAKPCKPLLSSDCTSKFCHLWKASIDKSVRCDHCSRRCWSNDYSVLQCQWCQKTVHQDCSM